MATNLDLDEKLIEAARKLGGHKTKREAVTRALQEYVRWLKQQAIVSEFGKIEYDPKRRRKNNSRLSDRLKGVVPRGQGLVVGQVQPVHLVARDLDSLLVGLAHEVCRNP